MSRDLRPLFDPRSIAVLGASADPAKWGHWLARGALKGEGRRSVFLVNRNGGEILGRAVYRSLADVPEPPELVALTVPAAGFEQAVDEALAAGAKALVGITAGLGELGADGQARERAIVERVRGAGAILLGPNCLGIFDASTELELGSNEVPPGSIGLVSQSGNLALELGLMAADVGLGFSRFVSLGNQADLDAAEVLVDMTHHEATHAIAIYCEDFRDGRAFAAAASGAVEAGKPVILLTAGRSEAGARAARSHTGALVSDLVAVDAACRAAGIQRVDTPKEMIDLAQASLTRSLPRGRRLAIAADGGGHGVIAADLAARAGLELPRLSEETAGRLASVLPPTATTRNPVDLAGGGEQDFSNFERVCRLLLESGEVDTALLTGYFGGYSQYSAEFLAAEVEVAHGMATAAFESGRPLVVQTMYWDAPAAVALREGGVPVYREIEAAAAAVVRLVERAGSRPRGIPALPPPEEGGPLPSDLSESYWAARRLAEQAGVPLVPARRAASLEEAVAAAEEVGYPVVLKALAAEHKSDAGGVVLDLGSEAELVEAFTGLSRRLGAAVYSVERLAAGTRGVELIVGVRRDRRFGPVVLVGLGGVYAELLRDVAVALAPVGEDEAAELLRSLRGVELLTGARGRPPVDVEAAARAASGLSRLAAASPDIAEIELNPLLVTPEGAVALDARAVAREEGESDAG